MRASIKQVAQRADVSTMTVSNVLRGRVQRVSQPTRERVLQAVRELDYVPVRSALQNRHIETHVVSVVLDHMAIEWHTLDAETFGGMRRAAREHGYDLLVNLRDKPNAMQPEAAWLLDRRSDGFIFVNPLHPQRTRRLLQTLVRHNIPVVTTQFADGPSTVPFVVADNTLAMRLAVEHLVQHGHRKIAHLAGPSWHSETRLRREGFVQAMQQVGLDTDGTYETGRDGGDVEKAQSALLNGAFSAAICWNDDYARKLWRAAENMGRRVPDDFSIIGMDDSIEAGYEGLTSITNLFGEIGRAAFEALLELMRGGDAACCQTIPVELVERKSVAAAS